MGRLFRISLHQAAGLSPGLARDVGQAILPAGGLSSPPGGLKGRLQPGLAATRRVFNYSAIILCLLSANAWAQLPDGPGKAETQKVCSQCHELERSISPRQDRGGWVATMDKMSTLGMKATDDELQAVLNYLSLHYPAEIVPPLNVNKARAIDLESALSLLRSQAAAIIKYRDKNGDFKSIEDLKKVPGVDVAKIEAKKDRLVFQ